MAASSALFAPDPGAVDSDVARLFSNKAPKGRRKASGAARPPAKQAAAVAAAAAALRAAAAMAEAPGSKRGRGDDSDDSDGPTKPPTQFQRAAARRVSAKMERAGKAAAARAEPPAAAPTDGEAERERLGRSVFVGNIPVSASRRALERHFSSFGTVESVRIRSAAAANPKMGKRAAVITQSIDTSVRDSVNAYVVFADAKAASTAVEAANGAVAFGRHLRVDHASPHGESAAQGALRPKRSVFVGSLPWEADEEQLWSLFEPCGKIEYVRLVRDGASQQGKGFGYVCFTQKESVEKALGVHGSEIGGRAIRVFRCANSNNAKRVRAREERRKTKKLGGATGGAGVGKPDHKPKAAFAKTAGQKLKRARKEKLAVKHKRKDKKRGAAQKAAKRVR